MEDEHSEALSTHLLPSMSIPKIHLGKRIDGDTLEFVEVLGVGGYGVVYRAVDVTTPERTSYAVKCLLTKNQHRRRIHIREIALHQITSAHPGIVTLHRIIDDDEYTYIIMDYAPDHDLFTQILHNCRYLGNDALIKHVFLQLVDAVEYCHSLGIYHRDLKPENILCFDDGYTVAITDFGLATTAQVSEELRTGSIYHMSPVYIADGLQPNPTECQGGEFALDGHYSPRSNDIWSLGIILLNLATGRNPWKTATMNDLTFQTYLRDPLNFFPSVLPVSLEINDLLLQMLHVDWKQRITLPELRLEMEDITTFYAPDVVFEGSQAKCPWELQPTTVQTVAVPEKASKAAPASQQLMSYWSLNSSEGDFGREIHDVPVCGLLSPQVSDFSLGKSRQQPQVVQKPHAMPVTRIPSATSTSSHRSYLSSPSTPGDDNGFKSSQFVEIAVDEEDVFEGESEHNESAFAETGMVSSMSSSRFLKVSRPTMGIRVSEDIKSRTTAESSQPISSRASIPKLNTEFNSGISLYSPEEENPQDLPSPDSIEWPETPLSHEIDPLYIDDNKGTFNPMKLFSRPSRLASPPPQKSTPRRAQGRRKATSDAERDVQGSEGRWKLGRLGSTRNWFSPSKLFVSTPAS
ncbi:hypothetical protein H0H93_009080 [Arthromyces matolae]|nr:hypothetical protein H0H93_009080 [Arthromyces matolae]